jgi:hypothetical protein
MGDINIILKSEMGHRVLSNYDFYIDGNGLELSGKTDSNGAFCKTGIPYGEYRLWIDDGELTIVSTEPGSDPEEIFIANHLLSEYMPEWTGPPEEEMNDQ